MSGAIINHRPSAPLGPSDHAHGLRHCDDRGGDDQRPHYVGLLLELAAVAPSMPTEQLIRSLSSRVPRGGLLAQRLGKWLVDSRS